MAHLPFSFRVALGWKGFLVMSKYLNRDYLKQNMMGPNSVKLLEQLIQGLQLNGTARILDLGCGTGLTSMYLADRSQATVFAVDLWISATENYRRFQEFSFGDKVVPIHADALHLPFAKEFFDAVVSVDSYHYFGRDPDYMDHHLAPLVKNGGLIALCFPGLKQDLKSIPDEMALAWGDEDFQTWHSCTWWCRLLQNAKLIDIISISEMDCFDECWNDWLTCDNEHAVIDRRAMEAGAGQYMNFVAMILRRKGDH